MKYEHGYFFPDDETHFGPFLAKGDYQILQREMGVGVCRALNMPRRCAVDVGAHVGLWAKPLSNVFEKVICFEPRPENVACLRKNLEKANAAVYPFGLSNTHEQKIFYMPTDMHNSGAGSLEAFAGRPASSITVELRTLDSFAIPEINFMKIDIQGWEIHALRGGVETLNRTRPVILCENHPENADLIAAFAALGYEKILRVVKEDIFVHLSLLSQDARKALITYFNERRDYFNTL